MVRQEQCDLRGLLRRVIEAFLPVERTEEALQLVLGAVKLQTKDKLD